MPILLVLVFSNVTGNNVIFSDYNIIKSFLIFKIRVSIVSYSGDIPNPSALDLRPNLFQHATTSQLQAFCGPEATSESLKVKDFMWEHASRAVCFA